MNATKECFKEIMMRAIKDKASIIAAFIDIVEKQKTSEDGLQKFIEAIEAGKTSNEQLSQMLRTVVKVQREQAGALRQLSVLAIIYAADGDMSSDAAKVSMNLGSGNEALQELWKQRFGR
jgi:hypothetical protein